MTLEEGGQGRFFHLVAQIFQAEYLQILLGCCDILMSEQKLHVAIDRVKDPSIVPQDKPWTIEIYKALAAEFRSLNEFHKIGRAHV